jgi:hypothetical protein
MPSSALAVVSTAVLLAVVLIADDDTHDDYRRMYIDAANTLFVCRLILNVRVCVRTVPSSTDIHVAIAEFKYTCQRQMQHDSRLYHHGTQCSHTCHRTQPIDYSFCGTAPPIHVCPNACARSIMFRPAHDCRQHISQ